MCREGLEGLRGVENSRSGNCRPRVADSLYRAQRLPLLTRSLGANVRKELEKKRLRNVFGPKLPYQEMSGPGPVQQR